jgi:hypothetical protein
MFPQYAKDVVENAALNTIGKVASYLHEQGYNAVTFVAGSDRLEDMKSLLTQYNGVEGKAHGFYKFDVIDFASSGDREDGAEGVAGVSASGARAAAANNDFEAFQESTGAGELAKPLFAAVRKGMGITGEVEEGWKSKVAGAALAGAAALGGSAQAQTSGEDFLPDIVAHVRFKVDGKEIIKDINLGTTYKSPREASEALEKFLKSKGIKYYEYDLERVKPKDDDYLDKTPYAGNGAGRMDKTPAVGSKSNRNYMSTEDWFGGYKSTGKWFLKKDGDVIRTVNGEPFTFKNKEDALKWAMKNYKVSYEKQRIIPTTNPDKNLITTEAPIEMDPSDPMDPMIYGAGGNPAKLKYRMLRAAGQLKDLAARAENADPSEWQIMARQFEELKMNMEQIRHALEELGKIKSKGGIRSRGITV